MICLFRLVLMFSSAAGLDWMVLMYWKMLLMLEHTTPIINHGFCLKQLRWWWKQGVPCNGSLL